MSNEEKLRREEYKKKRSKLILIQLIVVLTMTLISACLFITYYQFDKNYYINYTENSEINYKVYLNENDFYENDFLDSGQAYLSDLIQSINAKFKYTLQMDSSNVSYEYTYRVEAQLMIVDQNTKLTVYDCVYPLIKEEKYQSKSDSLNIEKDVLIDYNFYNDIVDSFYDKYGSNNLYSYILVSAHVNVLSNCSDFANENKNENIISLSVPLNQRLVNIDILTSVDDSETKILACDKGVNKDSFLTAAIIVASLDAFIAIFLICFVYFTRDTHINYAIKINKIVNSYKSFIQRINNVFDTTGYQVLLVNSIIEMLEIRDTLQSPILMSENEDKTMTQFIIPTNNKILYVFEVKIENYDEIYGLKEDTNNKVVDGIVNEKEKIIIENEPIIVEDNDIEESDDSEEFDSFSHLQYSYSFEAKLALSKEEVQSFYKEIIKYIKEYGVKVTRSFKRERVHQGRKLFATFVYRGKTLCVLFPLDPKNEDFAKYRFVDMSEYKKYIDTPSLIKITSNRKVKYVIEVLEKIFTSNDIENKNLSVKVDNIKKKSKATLIKEGLIKKINKD